MPRIALLMLLNDEFLQYAKIFLHSLVKYNPAFIHDILLLTDTTLSSDSVKQLSKIYPNIKRIYVQTESYNSCSPLTRKWGVNLLYRFDIFEFGNLGYDRIISVDADMIVTGNIDGLINYDVALFGACRKSLDKREANIFNCGLMVFSKEMLRATHKYELLQLAATGCFESDQPLFNRYLEKYIEFLPQKYNVTVDVVDNNLINEGIIFHFAGNIKPYGLKKKIENGFNKGIVKERGIPLLTAFTCKLKVLEREASKLYV